MDERTHEQARLGRAWDHLLANSPAILTPDAAFLPMLRQIHALDRTPGPDRGFVARLEQRLIAGSPAAPAAESDGPVSPRDGRTPLSLPDWRWAPPPGRRRWPFSQAVTAAAVALLVVAVVVVFRLGGLPPGPSEPTSAASLQADDSGIAAALLTPECDVPARPRADFVALLATPAGAAADVSGAQTPVAASTPPPATGESADAATVEAVAATVRELLACHNARDPARHYALFTDPALARTFAVSDFSPQVIVNSIDYLASLATPPPPGPPDEARSLAGIRDVTVQPDGRVRAVIDVGTAGGAFSLVMFFVERAGVLLIDDVVGWTVPSGTPEPATAEAFDPFATPAVCDGPSRPVDDFLAAAAVPDVVPTAADATAPATPPSSLDGRPIDNRAITAAVTATINELIACWNAIDEQRYYALFTDDAFGRLNAQGVPAALLRALDLPPGSIAADLAQSLVSVGGVERLLDGRLKATVVIDSEASPDAVYEMVFVEEDGVYLIDDVIGWTRVVGSDRSLTQPPAQSTP